MRWLILACVIFASTNFGCNKEPNMPHWYDAREYDGGEVDVVKAGPEVMYVFEYERKGKLYLVFVYDESSFSGGGIAVIPIEKETNDAEEKS